MVLENTLGHDRFFVSLCVLELTGPAFSQLAFDLLYCAKTIACKWPLQLPSAAEVAYDLRIDV